MRHVTDLVSLAEANDRRKIVLDDAKVVAVVRDVGRKKQCVAASNDALLAQVGRMPINFERELICLHDARRLDEPLADLREKGEIAVRFGVIIDETSVGELRHAKSCGKLHERAGG